MFLLFQLPDPVLRDLNSSLLEQPSDRTLERLQTVYEVIARPDKTLDTVLTDRYYRAVGLVEEYDETYDATEVLNRMQKGNDAR